MSPSGTRLSTSSSETGLLLATLALVSAGVAAPALVHFDETDAQLYRVVARHLVEDRAWLDLRYLPSVYPHFREHLPFGLWPAAATIRIFGEGALPVTYAAMTILTLALVGWLGARLYGVWAGVVAMLVLGTCEGFFLHGSHPLLEPPLLLFVTASAAPLLFEEAGPRAWLWALGLGSLATLIKGPFGLIPFAAVSASRALLNRSPSELALSVGATALLLVPPAAFLVYDFAWGDQSWWTGYVRNQILVSVTGQRSEGTLPFWFPWRTFVGRLAPAVPLAALACIRAFRPSRGRSAWSLRVLALSCLFALVALGLPARKLWTHEFIVFPMLTLLAGAGAGPILDRWLGGSALRGGKIALSALTGLAWLAAFAGIGRSLVPKPSVVCAELLPYFDTLPPGEAILLVAEPVDWSVIAALAADRRAVPYPVGQLDTTDVHLDTNAPRMALARLDQLPVKTSPWIEISRARGWALLRKF